MHAECNVVMAYLSVCLSVHLSHTGIVLKWMHTWSNFPRSGRDITSFLSATSITKFQEELPKWGVKCTGWEKLVVFDQNHRLSRELYKISHGYYGSSAVIDSQQICQFQWSSVMWKTGREGSNFSGVTQVGKSMFCRWSAMPPYPKGWGPRVPIFWDPLPMSIQFDREWQNLVQ